MRRVAVSGLGVVSPLGNNAAEVLAHARAGHSGVRRLEMPFSSRLAAPIAATACFDADRDLEPGKARMLDRFSQLALFAANQAVQGSRGALDGVDRERAGVFVGTGMGGTMTMDGGYETLYGQGSDRIKPFTILMGMHNAAAAWIGIEHELRGPNMTYSTACSSSAVAIGEAWMRVACGQLEVAIAGGAEAPLSPGSLKAWEALHTVATLDVEDPSASCRPFSKNRSGMVLGEGAAMLVIEPWDRAVARGAAICGEILGYGQSNDASHITRPSVEGQAAAMAAALRVAGMDGRAVDAINAHGTGTQANDRTETAAIRAVFGAHAEQIPISATKATSEAYYEGRLVPAPGLKRQQLDGAAPFAAPGLFLVEVAHQGNQAQSPEEVKAVVAISSALLQVGTTWTSPDGHSRRLAPSDILVVAPYNAQVSALRRALAELQVVRVGTVDKFQGQEATVVIYSCTSSSHEEAPRGMAFLYDPHRFNVATSRARSTVIVVASPKLFEPDCRSPEQMTWANGFCLFAERAVRVAVP